jgi:hypothetical protein
MDIIGNYEIESLKIGGAGIRVQFDETAICNGRLIIKPSNTQDDVFGTQWIIGDVVQNDSRQFILKLVPNRRAETIQSLFEECVFKESIIITDGYPSYPIAVRNFGSVHEVVNHSIGFVNESGAHTNQIENLWSHLKQEYRARGGVNIIGCNFF